MPKKPDCLLNMKEIRTNFNFGVGCLFLRGDKIYSLVHGSLKDEQFSSHCRSTRSRCLEIFVKSHFFLVLVNVDGVVKVWISIFILYRSKQKTQYPPVWYTSPLVELVVFLQSLSMESTQLLLSFSPHTPTQLSTQTIEAKEKTILILSYDAASSCSCVGLTRMMLVNRPEIKQD